MPDTREAADWEDDNTGSLPALDEDVGEFAFQFDAAPDVEERDEYGNVTNAGWYWQKDLLDWWLTNRRSIVLKARQLGATWLAAGLALWLLLFRPGSQVLVYRQREKDAKKIIGRIWDMWESLPPWLRNGAVVITPSRGVRPSDVIEFRFPGGKVSTVTGMPATAAAGHGDTVALAILDEFSRIETASETMKAVGPALGRTGKLIILSTANGVANLETGEGNYYHYVWENAKAMRFARRFLPWSLHPDRDQEWYETSEEILSLRPHERAEQYPANPHEAFTLTNRVFFDAEAMEWYAAHAIRRPTRVYDFQKVNAKQAEIVDRKDGRINEYQAPKDGSSYALAADAATARGLDYSAAYVIDLATLEICAEFHGKLDADLFAYQLHFLGRRYRTAWLAIEMAGGYGDAVLIPLRDGREGRPAYPKLYRHTLESRVDLPQAKTYGYPMTTKTRPQVTGHMAKLVREKALPYLTEDLLLEMRHFVEHETGTTPAAQVGTHDDRVMAACVVLELYRQRGSHPERHKPGKQKPYTPSYPWQPAADEGNKHVRTRYRSDDGRPVDRDGHAAPRARRTGSRRSARGPR